MEELKKENYLEKKSTEKLTKEELIIDGETLDEIKKKKEKQKKTILNE